MSWILHHGNALEKLMGMSAGCINCCVTSPPYFNLRDYGTEPIYWPEVIYSPMAGLPEITIPAMECSLGLEVTPEAYVGHMMLIFREIKRVLRDDGTCWVNLGDSYSSKPQMDNFSDPKAPRRLPENRCRTLYNKA